MCLWLFSFCIYKFYSEEVCTFCISSKNEIDEMVHNLMTVTAENVAFKL